MGNLESKFSEAGVEQMDAFMESIPIIYYATPLMYGYDHYLEGSTFTNTHLPIIGTHVIAPLNAKSSFDAFAHLSNKEVMEFNPKGWVKMYSDTYRQHPPKHFYRSPGSPDETTYLFNAHQHTVSLVDSPLIYDLLHLKSNDMSGEFMAVSLPPSAPLSFPDIYRCHPYKMWEAFTAFKEEDIDALVKAQSSSYRGVKKDNFLPKAIIPKLFPLKIGPNPTEGPELKSIINVTLNQITNLDKNLLNLRHNVSAPFEVACVAISIDMDNYRPADTMIPVNKFVEDVVGAIRDGSTINILGLNVHVFHRGNFVALDSDSGATEARILEKLEAVGVNPEKVFFHHVEQVEKDKANIETFAGIAKVHYDAIWPEIFRAYLRSQSTKAQYKSLCQGKAPIEPWISYSGYPVVNHLEQVRRSYLVKAHRNFLLQSPLMSRHDIEYSRRIVAHALVSMGADVSKHRSKKVRQWGEKIHKANAKPASELPAIVPPFVVNTTNGQIGAEHIDGVNAALTRSDLTILDRAWIKQDNGNGVQPVVKCLLFDPKSTGAPEDAPKPLIVPEVSDIEGVDLRAFPFTKYLGDNSASDESQHTNLHLLSETEFNFNAFISNRYLLGLQAYQSTVTLDADARARRQYSMFHPVEDLTRVNIIASNTYLDFNPDFKTQVHALFPGLGCNGVTNSVFDYSPIIDGLNRDIAAAREKNRTNSHKVEAKTEHALKTVYDNYSPAQLNLIAKNLASPTKSTIEFLYRNDNTLFVPASVRKLKNVFLVDEARSHAQQCNGPQNLRWFSPLRYLFGVHLLEYSHTCSLPYNPIWEDLLKEQRVSAGSEQATKAKKTLRNSIVDLPPSLQEQTNGMLTIPTLIPFFPQLLSQEYGQANPAGANADDDSDADEPVEEGDEQAAAKPPVTGESLLSYSWRVEKAPFEPYKLESIYHDHDELHTNAHMGCPIHVVFIIPQPAPPVPVQEPGKAPPAKKISFMEDRAQQMNYKSGIYATAARVCQKLNISNVSGARVSYTNTTSGDQADPESIEGRLPTVVQNTTSPYNLMEEKLEPHNYQGITDVLSTHYPDGSDEANAVIKYRKQLDASCKDDLKNYVLKDKLVPHQFIEDNYHFHIVTHDQLDYLLVQIQSDALLKRFQMYATLMGKQ